jgi:hypothetical protein
VSIRVEERWRSVDGGLGGEPVGGRLILFSGVITVAVVPGRVPGEEEPRL